MLGIIHNGLHRKSGNTQKRGMYRTKTMQRENNEYGFGTTQTGNLFLTSEKMIGHNCCGVKPLLKFPNYSNLASSSLKHVVNPQNLGEQKKPQKWRQTKPLVLGVVLVENTWCA